MSAIVVHREHQVVDSRTHRASVGGLLNSYRLPHARLQSRLRVGNCAGFGRRSFLFNRAGDASRVGGGPAILLPAEPVAAVPLGWSFTSADEFLELRALTLAGVDATVAAQIINSKSAHHTPHELVEPNESHSLKSSPMRLPDEANQTGEAFPSARTEFPRT